MAFGVSPGVYNRIIDRSQIVSGQGPLAGAIVITAKRGPTEINLVSSARQFVDVYGEPTRDNPSMWAAYRFLQRAGFLNVLRITTDAAAASGIAEDGSAATEATFTAANPGAWGNDLIVSFATPTNAPSGVFIVSVSLDGEVVENFEVSRDPAAKNGFGKSIYIEDVINVRSQYIRVEDDPLVTPGAIYTAETVTLANGSDDTTAPTDGDIVSAWDGFLNTSEVDARYLINAGWATPAVQQKMLLVAEQRRDAYAILDCPQDVNTVAADIVAYRNDDLASNSYHGSIYGGWLNILDQFSGVEIQIPPSGDVAANYVRTASEAEVWVPVMGVDFGNIPNVLSVSKKFSEAEMDLLYSNGVNPVTKIGAAASVIWGQKSLQMVASGLDRANVVLNVKDIDVRLKEAMLPFVGKPNLKTYRDNANFIITRFLDTRQRLGGLYDFYVDTSEEINTPDVIDEQKFLIEVYVQPVKAMEFIRVSLIVTQTGVTVAQ